jgi:hypothetical protein
MTFWGQKKLNVSFFTLNAVFFKVIESGESIFEFVAVATDEKIEEVVRDASA